MLKDAFAKAVVQICRSCALGIKWDDRPFELHQGATVIHISFYLIDGPSDVEKPPV